MVADGWVRQRDQLTLVADSDRTLVGRRSNGLVAVSLDAAIETVKGVERGVKRKAA
jgi:hypothetical protein